MAKGQTIIVILSCLIGVRAVSHVWKEHWQDGAKCCSTDPSKPSRSCEQTTLVANSFIQAVITPGYPHGLPAYRQCTWTIQTKPGKRVRIDFRDFYLVGPNQEGECEEQSVTVMSSLQYKMGPYCGNTGLQAIVAPDNFLVIQLETRAAASVENYRGFRLEFRETEETPSQELRPPNWRNGNDMFLVGNQLQNAISRYGPASNGASQTKPTVKPSSSVSQKPNESPARNSRPKWTNQQKPSAGSGLQNQNRGVNQLHYGPSQRRKFKITDQSQPKPAAKSSLPISLEIIVGISVGGVVLLALIALMICKLRQRSGPEKSTSKANGNEESSVESMNHSAGSEKLAAAPLPQAVQGPTQYTTSSTFHPNAEPVTVATCVPPGTYGSFGNISGVPQDPVQTHYPPHYPASPNLPPTPPYNAAAVHVLGQQPAAYDAAMQRPQVYGSMPGYGQPESNVMLFDPNTGVCFDPSQLQVVQKPPPFYHQEQPGAAGYFTLPFGQHATVNDIFPAQSGFQNKISSSREKSTHREKQRSKSVEKRRQNRRRKKKH